MYATGHATRLAISIQKTNCREIVAVTSAMLAPKTFLILISFLRCSVTNMASPSKPRQATSTPNADNKVDNALTFLSLLYKLSILSLRKLKLHFSTDSKPLHVASTYLRTFAASLPLYLMVM